MTTGEGPGKACDLADLARWKKRLAGREALDARLCFGPLARWVTRLAGADGLVLGRRVFLSPTAWMLVQNGSRRALELLEHELVHVEQYRRLGLVGFLGRYLRDYFAGRLRGLDHLAAYRAISLEREARAVAASRARVTVS